MAPGGDHHAALCSRPRGVGGGQRAHRGDRLPGSGPAHRQLQPGRAPPGRRPRRADLPSGGHARPVDPSRLARRPHRQPRLHHRRLLRRRRWPPGPRRLRCHHAPPAWHGLYFTWWSATPTACAAAPTLPQQRRQWLLRGCSRSSPVAAENHLCPPAALTRRPIPTGLGSPTPGIGANLAAIGSVRACKTPPRAGSAPTGSLGCPACHGDCLARFGG